MPFANYHETAVALDDLRLGKQRVECLQILNALTGRSKGWIHHPATKMWKGYEHELANYGLVICREWINRGHQDTCLKKILDIRSTPVVQSTAITGTPPWLGDPAFHQSHMSKLLQKDFDHYKQAFDLTDQVAKFIMAVSPEYFWPTKEPSYASLY